MSRCSDLCNGKDSRWDAAQRVHRLSNQDLFMFLAWHLEASPLSRAPPDLPQGNIIKKFNKVGALIVTPEHHVLAMECTRGRVHAVQKLIIRCRINNLKIEGCELFVSRMPCAMCTKLIIQAKLKKVYCLPIEPENYSDVDKPVWDDKKAVDRLFKVNSIGISFYIPELGSDENYEKVLNKKSPQVGTPLKNISDIERSVSCDDPKFRLWPRLIFEDYDSDEDFGHSKKALFEQCKGDMSRAVTWLEKVTRMDFTPQLRFCQIEDSSMTPVFDQNKTQLALHSLQMANILVQRSDDPRRGIGAVIMQGEDYCGVGVNEFTAGAQFTDYPRAADADDKPFERKYPYMIHSEMNALFQSFFWPDSKGPRVSYQTRIPCDECAPLIVEFGVHEVVTAKEPQIVGLVKNGISYRVFGELVQEGRIKGYWGVYPASNTSQQMEDEDLDDECEPEQPGLKKIKSI